MSFLRFVLALGAVAAVVIHHRNTVERMLWHRPAGVPEGLLIAHVVLEACVALGAIWWAHRELRRFERSFGRPGCSGKAL